MLGFGTRFVSGVSFCSSLTRLLGFNYSYCLTQVPSACRFTIVRGESGCSGAELGGLGLISGDAALQELLLHPGMPWSTQVTGFDFEYRWLEYTPYTHFKPRLCRITAG